MRGRDAALDRLAPVLDTGLPVTETDLLWVSDGLPWASNDLNKLFYPEVQFDLERCNVFFAVNRMLRLRSDACDETVFLAQLRLWWAGSFWCGRTRLEVISGTTEDFKEFRYWLQGATIELWTYQPAAT